MSEPILPPPGSPSPDGDDDRLLDEFLARRGELSRLYRESATEAPADFDAAILAAARAAVVDAPAATPERNKPLRRANPRALRRWTLPVSLAASLVLGVGILRQVQQDPAALDIVTADAAKARLESGAANNGASADIKPDSVADQPSGQAVAAAERANLERYRSETMNSIARSAQAPIDSEALMEADRRISVAAADARAAPPPPATAPASVADAVVPPPESATLAAAPAPPTAAVAETDAAPSASSVRKLPPLARPSATPAERPLGPTPDVAAALAAKRTRAEVAAQQAAGQQRAASESAKAQAAATAAGAALDSAVATGARIGWKSASYRGLRFGFATEDDVLRRFGPPETATEVASDITLPDGRRAHRLFEYSAPAEPRGRLRLYFDKTSLALAYGVVVLDPPLPLNEVMASEALTGPGIARAADAALCGDEAAPPRPPFYPQLRVHASQGIQLLLTAPDRVAEISYFDLCR